MIRTLLFVVLIVTVLGGLWAWHQGIATSPSLTQQGQGLTAPVAGSAAVSITAGNATTGITLSPPGATNGSSSVGGGAGTANASYVPASTMVLEQWTGDLTQIYSGGRDYTFPTNSLSQTNYGVWGQGAGASAQFPDGRIFFFFGDTVTAYKGADGHWYDYQRNNCGEAGNGTCIGVDTIGFIQNADGLSQCKYLDLVSQSLQTGTTLPSSYGSCPTIQYITDPSHTPSTAMPKVAWTQDSSVSGLVGNEGVLNDRIPTGVFVNGTSLYSMYEAVTRKPKIQGTKYEIDTMLLKATQPTNAIQGNTPITWKRLYSWSLANIPTGSAAIVKGSTLVSSAAGTFQSKWANHPMAWQGIEINGTTYQISSVSWDGSSLTLNTPIQTTSDPNAVFNVLPAQNTQPGKFMSDAPFLLDLPTMNALGIESHLPAALQGLNKVLFTIGSGYLWRAENVFLMAMNPNLLDSSSNSGNGVANAWYLTGVSNGMATWDRGDETNAVPLLNSWQHGGGLPNAPCIGEVSVQWAPLLNRFLMTYGDASCGGIYLRTSATPWGPWSDETLILPNTPGQGWEGQLVHANNPDFNDKPIIFDGTKPCCTTMSSIGISPWGKPGNPFAPFLLPVQSDNGNGTVRAYMNISTFDPYVVFLFSFDVHKPQVVITR